MLLFDSSALTIDRKVRCRISWLVELNPRLWGNPWRSTMDRSGGKVGRSGRKRPVVSSAPSFSDIDFSLPRAC